MATLRLIGLDTNVVVLVRPLHIIGRNKELSNHVILDTEVSRQHCQFDWRDNRWWVIDLNSLNGVYLNGQQLREPSYLIHGDHVRIGKTTFVVDTTYGESE